MNIFPKYHIRSFAQTRFLDYYANSVFLLELYKVWNNETVKFALFSKRKTMRLKEKAS